MLTSIFWTAALATTYTHTYDWPIRGPVQSIAGQAPDDSGSFVPQLKMYVWDITGWTDPVGEVVSDWSRVKCGRDSSGLIYAQGYFHPSDWPTTAEWDAHPTVTCSYTGGGFTAEAVITIKPSYTTWRAGGASHQPTGWTPTTGIPIVFSGGTYNIDGTSKIFKQTSVKIARKLPAATYTTTSWIPAKRWTGSAWIDWTGVYCVVNDTDDILYVAVYRSAAERTGAKCVLQRSSGGPLEVTGISLDRP